MSLILYLILLAIGGLFVGALARLILPGRDPMTVGQTILVGVAGTFAAGLVSLAIFHGRHGGGLLLSLAFAVLFVWLIRKSRERSMQRGTQGRPGFGL
jgi:uncharacterized membrane protein YeaQ/YmgE (transglycosylase-associated protein family)